MSSAQAVMADMNDDHLSNRNFERLAVHIRKTAGITLTEKKRMMLEGRLRRRLKLVGAADLDDYCDYVFAGDTADAEQQHLINAVTTNKTDFFREPKHFEYLEDKLLPELARQGARKVTVWSAACSTGAEPYTIAMLLDDFAAQRPGMSYQILATDIDTQVLRAAHRGVYNEELLDPVPAALRRKYVMRSRDTRCADVRISPKLRAAIAFGQLNLMDASYGVGAAIDMIFCRNVLIYFEKETQEAVVQRLVRCLKPGGYLFLGHAESITGFDVPVTQVGSTIFRRNG
jgi:chemotaxis protein methyltransferase CheR